MKLNLAGRAGLAGLLAVLVVDLHTAPAEACGVKLTIKTSAPRKAVARSSTPSRLLVLGTPPRRLERDLSAAGHDVEVAPNPSAAKRSSYAAVIVDSDEQASDARSRFGEDVVIVRSGDVGADIRTVEARVARRPVRSDESRAVVAARAGRAPIAAGPTQDAPREVVAVKPPGDAPAQPDPVPPRQPTAPQPAPAKVSATVAKPRETAPPVERKDPPSEPTPDRTPRSAASTSAVLQEEVYFATASARVGNKARLAKAVRWLTTNASVNAVIEGHADPTGSPEANMTLSQTRAESVRDYLVSAGIDPSRLEVVPYGDTRIKYSSTDRRNRRVAVEAKK